ncbi:sulfite exporter TauE/SafE family protein [Pseudalkalibacillus decolorationis]|uniref:sulfite exporter TauE/SafE family protein n=1 Tax=Pseudalkalibacillus decolorationis TaxID=163879 RepID=UPI002149847B|nr:sulfite exporter TauE/SafE family protein [Pseudalkalibacillus decolorationis]
MYEFFTSITRLFYEPLTNAVYNTENVPIISAFFIGLLGSLAPCQLTGNIGAITIYGNRSIQKEVSWAEILFFLLGKIAVFSCLGIIVWILGQEFEKTMVGVLPWIRKLIGPLFIVIGLVMLGYLKLKWNFTSDRWLKRVTGRGKRQSFFLGFLFSLGFCPTMFLLFFGLLMPLVLSNPYGSILPSIFAIGTSVPVIIVVFLIWYFGLSGSILKKSRKFGLFIQRLSGVFILILGILDTITYWTL